MAKEATSNVAGGAVLAAEAKRRMTRRTFERGDMVGVTFSYAGHDKTHVGKVLDIGRNGARVLVGFRDKPGQDWFAASKLKFVVGVDAHNLPVLSEERPDDSAPTKDQREEPTTMKTAPDPPPSVTTTTPALPSGAMSTLDALESAGVDALAMWVALGRELTGREERAVASAETAVRAADIEVAAAEAMLVEARASAARAREALDAARERLTSVLHRTTGAAR